MDSDEKILFGVLAVFLLFVLGAIIVLIVLALKHRKYMQSPAESDDIVGRFFDCLEEVAKDEIAADFNSQGKSVYTQKGAYRVDFLKAVQKRKGEYSALGVSNTGAVLFIQEHYPELTRAQLDAAIMEYIYYARSSGEQELHRSRTAALTDGITPEVFLQAAKSITGDLVGVYIIYNQTKDMYYVGQAKRLYFRVKQHFTGHGNGDVYADYKYGDAFLIRLIMLRESGYDDLDKLERDMIAQYRAYERGYNKTAGNQP